jgi:hypothetical protein
MPMQRSPGPFHYLIHEQAKSLVALQVSTGFVDGLIDTVAYPGILLRGGGSTNSVEDRGQRERGYLGAVVP